MSYPRAWMLLLNAWPLAHLALLGALAFWRQPLWLLAALYLLPPLLARGLCALWGRPCGRIPVDSPQFLVWWGLVCLQMVFARLPILEELLRLVPGAYSAWLRLWGSRIGRFTYWAPGTAVLDRGYLELGDGVVLGSAVRLNPHVMWRNDQGQLELVLAPVCVGSGALIGGYSLLTAGSRVAPDECPRACITLPPFSVFEGGMRRKAEC